MKNVIVVVGDSPNELGDLHKILKDTFMLGEVQVRTYLSIRDALATIYLIERHKYKVSAVISNKLSKEHEVVDLLKKTHNERPDVTLIVIGNSLCEPLDFDYICVDEAHHLKEIIYDLARKTP